jgi:hypothetical protein
VKSRHVDLILHFSPVLYLPCQLSWLRYIPCAQPGVSGDCSFLLADDKQSTCVKHVPASPTHSHSHTHSRCLICSSSSIRHSLRLLAVNAIPSAPSRPLTTPWPDLLVVPSPLSACILPNLATASLWSARCLRQPRWCAHSQSEPPRQRPVLAGQQRLDLTNRAPSSCCRKRPTRMR